MNFPGAPIRAGKKLCNLTHPFGYYSFSSTIALYRCCSCMDAPPDLMNAVILGIDPAIASIGFGIIRGDQALDYGVISTPANTPMYERLRQIRADVQEVCHLFKPDIAALEMPFFGRENTNANKVLRAMGVIELALGDSGLTDLIFLHQSQVKAAVARYGADKFEIKQAVMQIFALPEPPSPDDSADGLAIAYAAQCGARANVA